jgi:hypothetical protein
MSILNEVEKYIIEEMKPVPHGNPLKFEESTFMTQDIVDKYDDAVVDCGEYNTVVDALNKVLDVTTKFGMTLLYEGTEWLGQTYGDIDTGKGNLMEFDMAMGEPARFVDNAKLFIEIYHTSEDTYELTTFIEMK